MSSFNYHDPVGLSIAYIRGFDYNHNVYNNSHINYNKMLQKQLF